MTDTTPSQQTYGPWVSLPEEEMAILLPDRNSSPIFEIKEHMENLNTQKNSSEKFMLEKQISDKYPKTRVMAHMNVEAIYHCAPQSVITVLSFHTEFDNYFVCNQVLDLSHDLKVNITAKKKLYKMNRNHVPTTLTIRDLPVQLVFFKGNLFIRTGRELYLIQW